ncbi:MAG: hypothetical protein P8Q26_10115 [Ascidiaceihabitans sp.]|nr:hypothetical protein [Ascidiaceihabitans sp.]
MKIKNMINTGILSGVACIAFDAYYDFETGVSRFAALLIGGAIGVGIGSEAQKEEDRAYNERRAEQKNMQMAEQDDRTLKD